VTESDGDSTTVFGDSQRRELAGRAQTLFERLSEPENERGEAKIDLDETFERWGSTLGEPLSTRLARDGLDLETARAAATATQWPASKPLPEWVDLIADLVSFLDERSVDPLDSDEPFDTFHAAVAAFGRNRLSLPTGEPVREDAVTTAVDWLRGRVARLSVRILYVEFKTFVARHDEELAFADPSAFGDPPTELYEQFLTGLFGNGFKRLCLEYPVYSRLLAMRLNQWCVALQELFDRLSSDRAAIADRFNSGDPLGDVTEISPLADDTHGDGRAVVAVTFESDTRIVYKPRPIEGLVSFYQLVERLDPHLSVPSLDQPSWLQRDGYGYVGWIEHHEAEDETAADRYYRRAGSLTCLSYAFEFEDCHFENLIAAGEHPLLIDGETFLAPYVEPSAREIPKQIAPIVDETVHASMLLPFGIDFLGNDGELGQAGMSGIGTDSDRVELPSVTRPRIKAANTDVMTVVQEAPSFRRATNTLEVNGAACPPVDHVEALVDGFTETHRTLRRLSDGDRLFGEILDGSILPGVENRFVYRATQQYASTVRSVCSRNCLQDGVAFTVGIDTALATAFTDGTIENDRLWELYEVERTAVGRLDPPRITGQTDGTELSFDGKRLDVEAARSGYDRAVDRIESLSERDERIQARLVSESVVEMPASGTTDGDRVYTAAPVATDEARAAVQSCETDAKALAGGLLDTVKSSRTDAFGDPSTWLFLDSERMNASKARLLEDSLGTGTPGVAAAAAVYASVSDDNGERFAAELGDDLTTAEYWGEWSHGAIFGTGARVYALSLLGEFVDERFLDAAVASLDDSVAVDEAPAAVSSGLAGSALSAVACYDRNGADRALSVARRCGDELRRRADAGRLPTGCGFETGRTGVAYALARLGAVDSTYIDTAEEVVETVLPSPAQSGSRPVVSRLGMVGLSRHLDCVTEPPPPTVATGGYDHLWGGRAGAIEHAVAVGGDPTEHHSLTQPLKLPGHVESFPNPTLFTGLSGVVYTLCRVCDPETVPMVTLFE
jgi:type 2 lantibiotic biosynthesis protein LanM